MPLVGLRSPRLIEFSFCLRGGKSRYHVWALRENCFLPSFEAFVYVIRKLRIGTGNGPSRTEIAKIAAEHARSLAGDFAIHIKAGKTFLCQLTSCTYFSLRCI